MGIGQSPPKVGYTFDLLLAVTMTAAGVQDRAVEVVAKAFRKVPGIERLYTGGAYGGKCAQAIEHIHGIRVEVVRRSGNRSTGTLNDPQPSLWPPTAAGCAVLPKCWGVEQTYAWGACWRRMVMHHDRKISISTASGWLAEARILLGQ